jgi:hypothetical protein
MDISISAASAAVSATAAAAGIAHFAHGRRSKQHCAVGYVPVRIQPCCKGSTCCSHMLQLLNIQGFPAPACLLSAIAALPVCANIHATCMQWANAQQHHPTSV